MFEFKYIPWSNWICFPVFSLIQFWILIRNELYHPQSIAKYVSMGNLKLQSLIYFSALVSCSGSISRTQSLWWHIAICFIAYFQYVLPSLDLYRWLQCCFILMPYPCSHFYFDIKFGDRLYSKEKRRAWHVLFWI